LVGVVAAAECLARAAQELHGGLQDLVGPPAPLLARAAGRLELLLVPAGPHAVDEAPPREVLKGGDLLGQHHRVVGGQDHDRGAQLDPGGHRGDVRQRHQRLGPADAVEPQGGEKVVGDEQRLEAEVLGVGGEAPDLLAMLRARSRQQVRGQEHAELHGLGSYGLASRMSMVNGPLRLPGTDGALHPYTPTHRFLYGDGGEQPKSRIPYAAVHVVADPLADTTPVSPAAVDWEATLAYRRHIWSYGLGVADAMDTAQRGMGLDWEASKELIRRSVAEARSMGGRIACGAQTDQLAPGSARSLSDVEAAYVEQCEFVEGT